MNPFLLDKYIAERDREAREFSTREQLLSTWKADRRAKRQAKRMPVFASLGRIFKTLRVKKAPRPVAEPDGAPLAVPKE